MNNEKEANENNGLKRSFEDEDDSENDSSMEDESESEENEGEEMELGENEREIQVDFEGQVPCPEDFNGIRSLLHQLFLKANINLSNLTDLILAQNFVGSVLKVQFNLLIILEYLGLFSYFPFSNVLMKKMMEVMMKVLLMRYMVSRQYWIYPTTR